MRRPSVALLLTGTLLHDDIPLFNRKRCGQKLCPS